MGGTSSALFIGHWDLVIPFHVLGTFLRRIGKCFTTCSAAVTFRGGEQQDFHREILDMAKKKGRRASGGGGARVPRKASYSAQRMEAILGRLKEQASRISSLAKSMDESRLDALQIDGHQMLLRGLNQIDNFIDNASRSVREARTRKEGI